MKVGDIVIVDFLHKSKSLEAEVVKYGRKWFQVKSEDPDIDRTRFSIDKGNKEYYIDEYSGYGFGHDYVIWESKEKYENHKRATYLRKQLQSVGWPWVSISLEKLEKIWALLQEDTDGK